MGWCTADLCDQFIQDLQVAEPVFRHFGGKPDFFGPAATLKVFEDNSLVRQALESPGKGRVLVVDGAGSVRRALLGDMLATLAVDNGWAGVIVYGAIRDSREMRDMPVGIRALNTCPRKSIKLGKGQSNIRLAFAGVNIGPGNWIYADDDGIVIAVRELPV